MTDTATPSHDNMEHYDRIYLEKLRLATEVILRAAEEDGIPDSLESELHIFRDRVERLLLL
ncbi:MAG: hypothetical protein J2P26_15380 [Nocardiopsaceae bacterium]|nr:hypothetical protein [Nocardiopsaceae bacterium]